MKKFLLAVFFVVILIMTLAVTVSAETISGNQDFISTHLLGINLSSKDIYIEAGTSTTIMISTPGNDHLTQPYLESTTDNQYLNCSFGRIGGNLSRNNYSLEITAYNNSPEHSKLTILLKNSLNGLIMDSIDLNIIVYSKKIETTYPAETELPIPVTCDWVLTETMSSTCTTKGYTQYTCQFCGDSYTETLPLIEHDWIYTNTTPATCVEQGTDNYNCSMCGTLGTIDIPALGHEYGEWETKVEAAIGKEGIEISNCIRNCGDYKERVIPALQKQEPDTISGACGDTAEFSLDPKTGVLKIIGSGAIWENAFNKESSDSVITSEQIELIKNVYIGGEITEIGKFAFYALENLEKVLFTDTLKTINAYAFAYCTSLKNIEFPAGLEYIYSNAFGDCTSIEELTIPSTIKSLGTYSFYDTNMLKNVYFGGSPSQWKTLTENLIGFSDNITVYYGMEDETNYLAIIGDMLPYIIVILIVLTIIIVAVAINKKPKDKAQSSSNYNNKQNIARETQVTKEKSQNTAESFCPVCGQRIQTGSNVCDVCGTKVSI